MNNRIILVILSFFLPWMGLSQDIQNLKQDPRVLRGKMPNGLTYYIVKNEAKKGTADFYLMQKGGYMQEDLSQTGMTELISNMGMMGTRNYSQHAIMEFLNGLGLDTMKDLEISTSFDGSFFRVSNIPVSKGKSVIDSMLLILFNWACSINFDEDDIERERILSANQLLLRNTVDSRFEDNVVNYLITGELYPVERYDRNIEIREHFTSKELRKYYYDWYRSDLQSLVIVGDVNPSALEAQIKTLFQATPKVLNPKPLRKVGLKDPARLHIIKVEDREADRSRVVFSYKSPLLPLKYRTTAIPFITGYMNSMLAYLLNDRMQLAMGQWGFPVADVEVVAGGLFGIPDFSSLDVSFTTTPEYTEEVTYLISSQIGRVMKDGFTEKEFERAHRRYYDDLLYRYNYRQLLPNSYYAHKCADNFFNGYALASIELQKEYLDNAEHHIKSDQFNTYSKSYFKDGTECILSLLLPAGYGKDIDEKNLERKYLEGIRESVPVFEDVPVLTSPLLSIPSTGSVVSEVKEPISQSVQWTLSNGAVVIAKQTDSEPGKFRFQAIAKGGLSLSDGNIPVWSMVINDVAAMESLAGRSHRSVKRYMQENNIRLRKDISLNMSRLVGDSYSSALPAFMELVNLHFSNAATDVKEVDRWMNNKKQLEAHAGNNVQKYFKDTLSSIIYQTEVMKASDDMEISAGKMGSFLNQLYANAANYTFIIVGDFDRVKLKELVSRYIASLPGDPHARENWRLLPFYTNKFDKNVSVVKKMQIPKEYNALVLAGAVPYNLEDVILHNMAYKLIERRMEKKSRELGIDIMMEQEYHVYPEEYMTLQFSFVSKKTPDDDLQQLKDILSDLAEKGVSDAELKTVKLIYERALNAEQTDENTYWTDILVNRFIYGKDFHTRRLDNVKNMDRTKINAVLKEYLEGSVKTVFSVNGER